MLTTDNIVHVEVNINEQSQTAVNYDTGLIIGTTTGTQVATDRVVKYTSAAAMLADSFTNESPQYKAAVLYFAQSPAPTAVYVGYRNASQTETIKAALQACYDVVGSFWGIYVCGITSADVLLAQEWLTEKNKGFLFFGVQASAENYTASVASTGVFAKLMERGSRRAAGLYAKRDYDAAAVMGKVAGLVHNYAGTAFSMCYKSLALVQTVKLTATQVGELDEVNANMYLTRGYVYNILEHATTGSGLRIDECLFLDMLTVDLKIAALGLIINSQGRMPQTDESSTMFKASMISVLNAYNNQGIIGDGNWNGSSVGQIVNGTHLSGGYYVYIAPYSMQTAADRAAHKAMPINVCVCLTGSIESVEISVDVTR